MGSVKGTHLFLFAPGIAPLLPSPVNSSTPHELGAREHRQDERGREERESERGGEREMGGRA